MRNRLIRIVAASAVLLGAGMAASPAGADEVGVGVYREITRYAEARWVGDLALGTDTVVLRFEKHETVLWTGHSSTSAFVSIRSGACVDVIGSCPAGLVMIPVDPDDVTFGDSPTMTASISTTFGACRLDVTAVGLNPPDWDEPTDSPIYGEDERVAVYSGTSTFAATSATATGDVCGLTEPDDEATGSISAYADDRAPRVFVAT